MYTQMADIEWRLLRWPLVILIVSLCISASLIGSSWYYQKKMQEQQKEAEQALKKIEEEYKKSQDALEVYQSFAKQFEQLQKYNFLQATELTNQWVERVEGLKNWQDFLTITNLQSEPPQNYSMSGVSMEKDFKIKLWRLRLQMQIWHMGNLLEFVDQLYASYEDGLYNLQECELSFKQTPDFKWQDNIKDAHLDGYCVLQWYAGEIHPEENK